MSLPLLESVTTTTEGSDFDIPNVPGLESYTVQVDLVGTVTACTVELRGKLAEASIASVVLGSYELTSADLTAKTAMFHVPTRPVDKMSAKLDVITGGGSASVYAKVK